MSVSSHKRMIYAVKGGQPIHIDDVERGLACGCFCPACGERLIARKGEKMMHHFAHRSGTECEKGYETSLHLAAKDILLRAGRMILPPASICFPDSPKVVPITDGPIELPIDRVELEQRMDTIIPDVVVFSGEKKLLVEIYVSHKVDDIKQKKIEELHLSAIEIDLSRVERTLSRVELVGILVDGTENKKWISNEYANQLKDQFYKVAEIKPIISRGYAIHVDNCPIKARVWHGIPYANVLDDCSHCKYMVSDNRERILCTGKERIASINDFNISLPERIKKEAEEKRKRFIEKALRSIEVGICPKCGEDLIVNPCEDRIIWECTNSRFCDFAAESDPETGEIIIL